MGACYRKRLNKLDRSAKGMSSAPRKNGRTIRKTRPLIHPSADTMSQKAYPATINTAKAKMNLMNMTIGAV